MASKTAVVRACSQALPLVKFMEKVSFPSAADLFSMQAQPGTAVLRWLALSHCERAVAGPPLPN